MVFKNKPQNNKIRIVMISDNNYAPYTSVSVASILKNAAPDDIITLHIIDDDISEKNKAKIKFLETLNPKAKIIFETSVKFRTANTCTDFTETPMTITKPIVRFSKKILSVNSFHHTT
jgi:lipopolysaccharide biosynthesis glycosyltransferase